MCGRTLLKLGTLNSQISKGLSRLRKRYPQPHLLEHCPFQLSLRKLILWCLLNQEQLSLKERPASLQVPIVGPRLITRLKAKQTPRGEVESAVHKEVGLNGLAKLSKQKSGDACRNGKGVG